MGSKQKSGYYTRGSVRGCCAHIHRSIGAALACIERDMSGCVSQGGYSDREVVRADGEDFTSGEELMLHDHEADRDGRGL